MLLAQISVIVFIRGKVFLFARMWKNLLRAK